MKPTIANLADWYWWQVNAPVWATHWNTRTESWVTLDGPTSERHLIGRPATKPQLPPGLPDCGKDAAHCNGGPDCKCGAKHFIDPANLETGRKYDAGKTQMSLIPPKAERLLAEVLTFGAEKYGPENWREVEDAERRYLDALMRHVNAYRSGQLLDEESQKPHLAHAMCCVAFLLELEGEKCD